MTLLPFDPRPFRASPLYVTLCDTVAGDPALLELAGHVRAGQQPAFAVFGAVHQLLRHGTRHELAGFYPSLAGGTARPPEQAGPAFADFCRTFREEIVEIVGTRLVQTNQVRRAVGLRLALAAIAPHTRAPVDLLEIGASAGLLLRFDRYGYRLRDAAGRERRHGDAASPVQLVTDVHGEIPVPDLDVLPDVASVTGIDLAPIDPTDPDSRDWLESLVWPEDHRQRRLLSAALRLAAEHPVGIRAGDAAAVLPRLAPTLAPGRERIVFHCATRMHVATGDRPAFDAAIQALSDTGPLWHVSIESAPQPDPRPDGAPDGAALQIVDPRGGSHLLAVVDGHLAWLEMIGNELTATAAQE